MIMGMTLYTFIHVVISLIGIGSGFIVVFGMLAAKRLDGWTALFLTTTLLTSVTGFFFPFHGFKPSYVVSALTLALLIVAMLARYSHRLTGGWRSTYVITAVIALYFNVFVLIIQSFLKVPALHALAPTGTEPPFKLAQIIALILFVILGIAGVKTFRIDSIQ
jgi:hypothetical protein